MSQAPQPAPVLRSTKRPTKLIVSGLNATLLIQTSPQTWAGSKGVFGANSFGREFHGNFSDSTTR
jgi:hypothetical protein